MHSDVYDQALESFDGNDPKPLKEILNQLDSDYVSTLIMTSNRSEKHQIANTWLTKAWQEKGNSLSDTHINEVCNALLDFKVWSAKLHSYQILESTPIPENYRDRLHDLSYTDTQSEKKILRAWAYFMWAKTAPEDTRNEVEETLRSQLKNENGAVAVRLRKALEFFS